MSAPSAPPVDTPIETPADPAPEPTVTETPAEAPAESAAPEVEAAAAPSPVEVTEPEKPEYMTKADWEREKAEVAQRAAAEALELDRRRRQTANARAAAQEKRDQEDRAELVDTVRGAFASRGVMDVPDDAVVTAIDRTVRKRSEAISAQALDTVDQAWDYLTSVAYGKDVELDETAENAAKRLGPKIQHLIDTIRPTIESNARKGYIAESELGKYVEAEISRRAAKSRDGETQLQRVEGTPASNVMSWQAYMNLPEEERAAMPESQRREIMAADRKARLGQ